MNDSDFNAAYFNFMKPGSVVRFVTVSWIRNVILLQFFSVLHATFRF